MIRRPPRSTLSSSSAASDVYKRQVHMFCHKGGMGCDGILKKFTLSISPVGIDGGIEAECQIDGEIGINVEGVTALTYTFIYNIVLCSSSDDCLLYTSDAADEEDSVDLGGRRIIKKKKKEMRTDVSVLMKNDYR
eukprot:TRINITY_DN42795_c0_g1_i2.p1 TRINITY_DN42795_c0_g1~~TRINITY_DN42795_c0_g1_i2.p1  ORF type:complete len:135 (-),score=26.55 TRINITY_DN42795_c0_g1_i2:11-415(-)